MKKLTFLLVMMTALMWSSVAHAAYLNGISQPNTYNFNDGPGPNYLDPNWANFESASGIHYARAGWAASSVATWNGSTCGAGPRYYSSTGSNSYVENFISNTYFAEHLVPIIALGMNDPAAPPSTSVEACAAEMLTRAATAVGVPTSYVFVEPYNEPDTGTPGIAQAISSQTYATYVTDVEYGSYIADAYYGSTGTVPILLGSFGSPYQEYGNNNNNGDCGGNWSYADCASSYLGGDGGWTHEIVGWSVHDYNDPWGAIWDYDNGYGIVAYNSALANFRGFDYQDPFGRSLPIWITETGGPVVAWNQSHTANNDWVGAYDVLYGLEPYAAETMWYEFATNGDPTTFPNGTPNPNYDPWNGTGGTPDTWDSALVASSGQPRSSFCVLTGETGCSGG